MAARVMNSSTLVRQNLKHFWRTNLAVILGVATAVAVLAGALLVGDSVRGSLRELALARLGNTDFVIAGQSFFREELAAELQTHDKFAASFKAACSLIALEGVVTRDDGARAGAHHKGFLSGRYKPRKPNSFDKCAAGFWDCGTMSTDLPGRGL